MSIRREVAHIRKDYLEASLEREQLAANPIHQFEQWFQEAVEQQVQEPNAMTLATVQDGKPTLRVVLLKGFDEQGLVFYTNYQSRKGQSIAENPHVALNFFWPELERQIRIEGTAAQISAEASDLYYQSRGRGSRLGAWASPQSQAIPNRTYLEERLAEVSARFADQEVFPKPDHWGGYRVEPSYLEFWQGRASRLHDRFVYELVGDTWEIRRLAP